MDLRRFATRPTSPPKDHPDQRPLPAAFVGVSLEVVTLAERVLDAIFSAQDTCRLEDLSAHVQTALGSAPRREEVLTYLTQALRCGDCPGAWWDEDTGQITALVF